jgi:hypothetical protein
VTDPVLITDPDAVNADWLTQVLAYAGYDAQVTACTVRQVGTGQMSRSYIYSLEVEGETGAPRSLVAKFNSTDAATRDIAKSMRCYLGEVGFYRELAPGLPIATPRCYFADIAEDEVSFVVVLEDMSPACQGDQMEGVSLPVAHEAVRELAKLHAATWNDDTLGDHSWLNSLARDQAGFYDSQLAVTQGFLERFADRIGEDVVTLVERMAQGCENLLECMREQPVTLIHWDFRADNILIDARSEPPAVTTVDWQTLTRGPPTQDLAYFLGASISSEVRKMHERELVAAYYDDVLSRGVGDYSWDQCWRGYQLGSFSGLTMAVRAAMLVEETERGNEMFATMARRHGRQILEIGADALL